MKAAIIGGGITGLSIGYLLSKQGVNVEIFEASPSLGGLAGSTTLEDGTMVDRFYHVILSNDQSMKQLCEELGISGKLRFNETRTGFYDQGKIHPMNSIVNFLLFPPIGWIDRFRLGLTVLYAQFFRDWRRLEGVSVEKWLTRVSGKKTYEKIWVPMLRAKFDGTFDNTPATYIWSRLVRMMSTRSGVEQKEKAGYLVGGFRTIIDALAEGIIAAGSEIHLCQPVQEIIIEENTARGLRLDSEVRSFDMVVAATEIPMFLRMIPGAKQEYRDYLGQAKYLGIMSVLMVLDRPLTGYWTLNIVDTRFPFTGVIETTAYIDPKDVGGHYLVYLPKYTAPDSDWQTRSDEEIKQIWMENLQVMFPGFTPDCVRYLLVQRERFVEPLHGLRETHLIPSITTPVKGLYLATTAQIYPALTNSESLTKHARKIIQAIEEAESGKIKSAKGTNPS